MLFKISFSLVSFYFIPFLLITSVKSQNLILNPGCEDSLINGEIPHWNEISGSNWTQRTTNPSPFEGLAYFFPGVASVAALGQDIDVSAYKSAIDDSVQLFIFEGHVRAYQQTPADESRITLAFLDSMKTGVVGFFDSGTYSLTTEWIQIIDTSYAPPGTRHIRIRLISTRRNGSNNDGYYDALSLTVTSPLGMKREKNSIPENPILFPNYPNPFNPTTTIAFNLPKTSEVSLKVFNLIGEEVATLLSASLLSGTHSAEWDASHLASGVYLYRLQAGDPSKGAGRGYVETRKMVLMK
jgi:hypothetical protein